MSRRILTVALAAAALFAAAAPTASAQWYLTQHEAERFARSDITARYLGLDFGDDSNAHPDCRPSRLTRLNASRGRAYHRWVCDWTADTMAGTSCVGSMVITGSRKDVNNTYGQSTLSGARCTLKGLQQYGGSPYGE